MTLTKSFRVRAMFVAAVIVAAVAGTLTSGGWSAVTGAKGVAPAASTSNLNQRYTDCIKANGATWTAIPDGGGMYQVNVPAAANAACAGLDLAREAAGDGDAATAVWLAKITSARAGFWSCISAAGFHITGSTGQRSDYGSAAFASTAQSCAATEGIALPTR